MLNTYPTEHLCKGAGENASALLPVSVNYTSLKLACSRNSVVSTSEEGSGDHQFKSPGGKSHFHFSCPFSLFASPVAHKHCLAGPLSDKPDSVAEHLKKQQR